MSFYYLILISVNMFTMHMDFLISVWSSYGKLASLSHVKQIWFFDKIWEELHLNIVQYLHIIHIFYKHFSPKMILKEFRFYMNGVISNIYSPIYLIVQFITVIHVSSFSRELMLAWNHRDSFWIYIEFIYWIFWYRKTGGIDRELGMEQCVHSNWCWVEFWCWRCFRKTHDILISMMCFVVDEFVISFDINTEIRGDHDPHWLYCINLPRWKW